MDDEGFISQSKMKCFCICTCIAICVTGIILLILGFSSLEATEYGLDYSWLSKTINPIVQTSGLYFIGIGHSFIKFPRNVQTIEFSKERTANRQAIESRTQDGLEVTLEISFQYILQPDGIYKLYEKYGLDYDKLIQNVAINILTEQATKYTAYDFFMKRGEIKDDFQNFLDKSLLDLSFTSVQFLQLRSVFLPTPFEDAIQESEVKKQDIQKATAELNKKKIEIDTLEKAAVIKKEATINIAKGEAEAIIQQNQADVESFKKRQGTQIEAYTKLKASLGVNEESLNDYLKTKLIKSYDNDKLVLSLDSPDKK